MADQLIPCVVSIPEPFSGEVCGRLSHCGAHLDDIASGDGVATIQARIPLPEIGQFRAWLAQALKGAGSIEER